MVSRVLGSAAAEGWPALFCDCQACHEARRRGGKDIRRRTTYWICEQVMVDFGPDAYCSMINFGLDFGPLQHLVITHSHGDHWTPAELRFRHEGYSQIAADSHLTVHGNRQVGEGLAEACPDLDRLALSFQLLTAGERRELTADLTVTALQANHAADDEEALNYVFTSSQGHNLLIGNDTGWWSEPVWEMLAGFQLHAVLLDCTGGPLGDSPQNPRPEWKNAHHLNCHWVVGVRDRLAESGALAPDCRFIANHFSHNGGWLHEDLEKYFTPKDIEVGYDGMAIEW